MPRRTKFMLLAVVFSLTMIAILVIGLLAAMAVPVIPR